MNSSRIITVLVGLALVFAMTAGVSAQNINVGIVELQPIVQQHAEAAAYQSEIQQEMQTLQQDFQEQTSDLDPQEDSEELQQIQQDFQQQATELQESFQDELLNILEPDFRAFMEANDYDMIAQPGGILASDANQENVTEAFLEFVSENNSEN